MRRVSLSVGQLRQVVPETLDYCWDLVVEGTDLAGVTLSIEHVPAIVECLDCLFLTELRRPVFRCCACRGVNVTPISGNELLVSSIDVMEVI